MQSAIKTFQLKAGIYKTDNTYDSVTKYYDSAVINAFNPVYNFHDTGVYNVCVIASYDSSCNKEYCNTIYIHDSTLNPFNDSSATSNTIISYPNPANDKVTFSMQLNNASPISINIYNLNGRNVYSSKTGGLKGKNTITIPVQNLLSGQYFIYINSNGQHKKSIFQKF